MSVEVKRVDLGLAKFWERLAELKTLSLTLGFQGASGAAIHPGAKVPVATIALYGEFGTIDSPARSFLRSVVFEKRREIADAFARELAGAVGGKHSPVVALSRVGAEVAKMVRDKIDSSPSWATPNAPSTIEKKGHAHPLRGGDPAKNLPPGTMREAVSWAVRKGGVIVAEGT